MLLPIDPKTYGDKTLFQLLTDNLELRTFAQKFYQSLSIVSPDRIVNPRGQHERRLESMARLLAGDEVCTAVVFDGEHLLIASNQTDHKEEAYQIEYQFIIQPGSSVQNGFDIRIRYQLFQHNKSEVRRLCEKDSEIIKYDYNQQSDMLIPRSRVLNPAFTFSDHQVPGLPEVGFPAQLADIDDASGEFFENISSVVKGGYHGGFMDFVVPHHIGIRAPYAPSRLDPLRRRTEILVEHLGFIPKYLLSSADEAKKAEARQAQFKNRVRILKNSLSWEIARWLKGLNKRMRQFNRNAGTSINEVNSFIEKLNDLYIGIRNSYTDLTLEELLEKWQQIALQKINVGSLTTPAILPVNQLKRFFKRMKAYLLDLEKLESYVTDISRPEHPKHGFAILLSQQGPFDRKTLPKIIDECDDKVHAEIRILYHYIKQGKEFPDYIAISKLCCAHCGFCLNSLAIDTISGVHGKAYPNWKIPKELINVEFLSKFLGEELFDMFQKFSLELKEQALSIVQSIAGLSAVQLKELGISDKKLWNSKSEFAYESDDDISSEEENAGYSASTLAGVFGIHQSIEPSVGDGQLDNSTVTLKSNQ